MILMTLMNGIWAKSNPPKFLTVAGRVGMERCSMIVKGEDKNGKGYIPMPATSLVGADRLDKPQGFRLPFDDK
jgi:hypothetical protein